HRATHLSSDGAPRRAKGFRVRPLHHGGAMAAGTFRRQNHSAGLALARTDAERAWGPRVRCDARNPCRTSGTGSLSKGLDDIPHYGRRGEAARPATIPPLWTIKPGWTPPVFLVNVCF